MLTTTCLVSLLLLSQSVLGGNGFPPVTTVHIAALREQIIEFVGKTEDSQKPDIGALVRLGFHDCASTNCDGCVDLTNPDNAGLENIIRDLNTKLYLDKDYGWDAIMSRADYYAFASQIAAIYAAELSPFYDDGAGDVLEMDFNYGRCTCAANDGTANGEDYPNAHGDFTHILDYFDRVFEYNMEESIAIMGAHTLGKCHTSASGFKGKWTENPSFLDNEYYEEIVDTQLVNNWVGEYFKAGGEWRFQFRPGPNSPKSDLMMLNADFAPLFDIHPDLYDDADGRIESCGSGDDEIDFVYPDDDKKGFTYVRDCPYVDDEESGETAVDIMLEYADDNLAWLIAFGEAFQKMVDKSPDCTLSLVDEPIPS